MHLMLAASADRSFSANTLKKFQQFGFEKSLTYNLYLTHAAVVVVQKIRKFSNGLPRLLICHQRAVHKRKIS